MSDIAAHISFGIAGWSYPDWEGIVYPRGIRDRLEYVTNYVDSRAQGAGAAGLAGKISGVERNMPLIRINKYLLDGAGLNGYA